MQLFRPSLRVKTGATQICMPVTAASRTSSLSARNQLANQRAETLVTCAYTQSRRSEVRQLCQSQTRQKHVSSTRNFSTSRSLKNTHDTQQSTTTTTTTTAAANKNEPTIHSCFESKTGTWQYVVADPSTKTAVIIDPVLDFDPVTQVISTSSADALLSLVQEQGYNVSMILETHAHADHITAASYLQAKLAKAQGGKRPVVGIGKRIEQVQNLFGARYVVPEGEREGNVFGKLFEDDEVFEVGDLKGMAIHLPGHTPDHLGYKIGDNVFCGDTIFHADIGTARCDFPGGSAQSLFKSGQKLLSFPDNVKIWTGHDYPPEGREPIPWMTVGEHKQVNKHLKTGISEKEFVAMREERDAGLAAPRLLHQSLQMNVRGGKLPQPTELGLRLLHLPLRMGGVDW